MTVPPRVRAVPPVRNASASSMQSPPASAEATKVITLSPVLARPGALPRSDALRTSWERPRWWARVTGSSSPALACQAGVVKRELDAVGVVAWYASIGCSFSGVGPVSKPLSQIHRSTFLPLQDTDPTSSFGGFGVSLTISSSIASVSRNRSSPPPAYDGAHSLCLRPVRLRSMMQPES